MELNLDVIQMHDIQWKILIISIHSLFVAFQFALVVDMRFSVHGLYLDGVG
jgi:hypothetical protein